MLSWQALQENLLRELPASERAGVERFDEPIEGISYSSNYGVVQAFRDSQSVVISGPQPRDVQLFDPHASEKTVLNVIKQKLEASRTGTPWTGPQRWGHKRPNAVTSIADSLLSSGVDVVGTVAHSGLFFNATCGESSHCVMKVDPVADQAVHISLGWASATVHRSPGLDFWVVDVMWRDRPRRWGFNLGANLDLASKDAPPDEVARDVLALIKRGEAGFVEEIASPLQTALDTGDPVEVAANWLAEMGFDPSLTWHLTESSIDTDYLESLADAAENEPYLSFTTEGVTNEAAEVAELDGVALFGLDPTTGELFTLTAPAESLVPVVLGGKHTLPELPFTRLYPQAFSSIWHDDEPFLSQEEFDYFADLHAAFVQRVEAHHGAGYLQLDGMTQEERDEAILDHREQLMNMTGSRQPAPVPEEA